MDSLDLDSLSIKDSDYLDCLDKSIQGQQDYTEDMDFNNDEQDIKDFKNIGVSSYSDANSQSDEPDYYDTQDFEDQTDNQAETSGPEQTVPDAPESQPETQTTDSQEPTIYTQSQVNDVKPDCSPYQNYINNYGNKENESNSSAPGEASHQSQDGLGKENTNSAPASLTSEQNPAASTSAAPVQQNQQGVNNNCTQDEPVQNNNNQSGMTTSQQLDNNQQSFPVNTGNMAVSDISDTSDMRSKDEPASINLSVALNTQNLIKVASVVGIAIVLLLIVICFTPKETKETPVKSTQYKAEETKTEKRNSQLDMFLERTTEDYGKVDEEVKEKGEGNKSSRFKTLDELTVYVENKTATLLSEEKMLKNQYDNGDITREKFETDLKGYIKEVDVLSHLLSLNKGEYSDEGKGETYDELSNNIASLTAYGDTLLYTD